MKIGIICPSEIAFRRFMPALQKMKKLEFIGVGMYSAKERFGSELIDEEVIKHTLKTEYGKAYTFIEQYGGEIFDSYESIVTSNKIDTIYIPLPPALHFKWAKVALEHGKHVLVEKPATISMKDSISLVKLAKDRKLAIHENYMFLFHSQLDAIDKIIRSDEIGDIRLYRMSFGFPRREINDFRYSKVLGGGALMDAGGYVIKYAAHLLGDSVKICCAQMNYIDDFDVDMYGSATLINDSGVTAQVSFGMDNNYKCELEIWGSQGYLSTGRIFTAPNGFAPQILIQKGNNYNKRVLLSDDAFGKSIEHFVKCIKDDKIRETNYTSIIKQAELIENFKFLANMK